MSVCNEVMSMTSSSAPSRTEAARVHWNHGDVAALGARPAFEEMLVVGRPNMPERGAFISRVEEMFDSRRLTNLGPMATEFEDHVARIAGAEHGVATCNATIGLELAISALELTGEVIVPSFTFVATVHALWRQNVRPVFCDIDPRTHCLDPVRVQGAITPRTTGILGVSLWGTYAGERELRRIADEHGLRFLLDSAHSFGCAREDGGARALCDAEVFSFHATKCVNSIEGGVIATNDAALAAQLRLMINFGFSGEDRVSHLGTNGKMNEAAAAMGLTSLEARELIFEHNRRNFVVYSDGLLDVPGVTVLRRDAAGRHNFQYVVLEIDEAATGLSRDELVAALRLENVLARRYFHPGCHRMAPYADLMPDAGEGLPVTEALAARVMVLPTGMAVTPEDVALLTGRISSIVLRAPEVRTALREGADPRIDALLP